MTPEEINIFGRRRYGLAWDRREGKERLAAELSRATSTIYEWLAGTSPVPETARRRLRELAKEWRKKGK